MFHVGRKMEMKKSTLITLIVSLLLIVAGFVLVGCGISSAYDTFEYRFGRAVYFESSFINYNLESKLLTTFGQMTFILGIAGVFLFAYLAIKNPKERKEKKIGESVRERAYAEPVHEYRAEPVHPVKEESSERVPEDGSENESGDTQETK